MFPAFSGTTSLFFAFPCVRWYVLAQHWYAVPVFQGILTLFVLVNFSMATFMDPGVIPRACPDEDRDDDFRAPLYRNVEINGITVGGYGTGTWRFFARFFALQISDIKQFRQKMQLRNTLYELLSNAD